MTASTSLVIFDCDGVLIDSEILAARVQSQALAEQGIALSPETAAQRFAGIPDHDMWQILQAEFGTTFAPHFEQNYAERLAHVFTHELRALPHVRDLIDTLNERAVRFCVASSSTPNKLRTTLTLTGLWPLFAPNVFSVAQVKHGKPAADLFLFAAQTMHVPAQHCLVIEDSVPGVLAACTAKMPVIGYTGASHIGAGHAQRLRAAGALDIIDDLAQVSHFLIP